MIASEPQLGSPPMSSPRRIMFFRPTLGQGGADRVQATLLRTFDRRLFQPSLVLLRREGVFLDDVPEDIRVFSLNVSRLSLAWLPLARLLRAERPDVLFSTSSAANIPAALAHAVAGRGSRLILSERNALLRGHATAKRRVEVGLKRLLYSRAHCITAVSQGVGDELVQDLRIDPNRVRVVYNPVVQPELRAAATEAVDHPWFAPGAAPVLLSAARLVPQKDQACLLRAFAEVQRSREVRLFLLGEGPEQPRLERLARELGVAERVCFAGFDKNPFRYMARCYAFVLSSRAEGLPGALIQAMACGAAVVATDCRHGPREVIDRPGENGFLVPVGDSAALAERLAWLLDNPVERDRCAAAAREAAQRYSVDAAVARYQGAVS